MINSKLNMRLFEATLLVALLFLAACGSAPPRQPAAVEKAKKTDQAAHRALRDGDLLRARELFNQSLLIHQSLENIPASATAAINLSAVLHKLNDDSAALDLLNGVLADTTSSVSPDMRAAAAFRRGVILADQGKTDDAESAVLLARKECREQCELEAGINNLQARLILGRGDFSTALAIARKVINQSAGKEELSNAQRIAAAAETALGQFDAALQHYQKALELDKELAHSGRIVEDLKGISKVLESLGRKQEAEFFAQRANTASMAARALNENKHRPIP